MFIRSERLFLRPPWPEDRDELHARISDEAIVRNLATAPWPYTIKDAEHFLARAGERDRLLPEFVITLPSASGSKLIGGIGLCEDGCDVEAGYWIARDHWGQGYATEALRALLGLARALGHHRIVASHFQDNPASGRVLRKAGFRPSGELRRRPSLGRGEEVTAIGFAVELGSSNGGDSSDPDGSADVKRAA